MRQFFKNIVLILLLLYVICLHGNTPNAINGKEFYNLTFQDSIEWADYYFNIHRYEKAIPIYEKNLDESDVRQKVHTLKKLSLSEAAIHKPEESVAYIYDYFRIEFHPNFLSHEGFDEIRETEEFTKLSGAVLPKISAWSVLYFFVSIIGFYVMFVLLLNKSIDLQARVLISLFVFIHSLFILNICLNNTNYVFEFPHTYLMSTWSSFLYGPLLFLYFRRVSKSSELKLSDLWHFLPTLGLVIYMILYVYAFTGPEKIDQMLDRLQQGLNPGDSTKLTLMVVIKAISLAIYAYFVHLIITKNKKGLEKKTRIWQKNMYGIHVSYVVIYLVYGLYIIAGKNSGFLFHAPIVLMSTMVLYIGYAANVQPNVFSGQYAYTNPLFPKYVKSGLTESLSQELKEDLHEIFNKDKLYRRNDISLDMVAQKLGTTRHNASQLINEHFNMSFHEFVNHHRINDAKELLKKERERNIIDIAYEVGYNNKVSFNKAFKKDTNLTPSQYLVHMKAR